MPDSADQAGIAFLASLFQCLTGRVGKFAREIAGEMLQNLLRILTVGKAPLGIFQLSLTECFYLVAQRTDSWHRIQRAHPVHKAHDLQVDDLLGFDRRFLARGFGWQ